MKYYQPGGETDSEQTFRYILNTPQEQQISSWGEDKFIRTENLLRKNNIVDNTLNCIFSNGNFLFWYSDENDHNAGLHLLQLSAVSDRYDLRDADNHYEESSRNQLDPKIENNQKSKKHLFPHAN